MSHHSKKSLIPDRWLDYSPVGKRLKGTRFISFKVPLKQSLNRLLPSSETFGFWELLDSVSREDQDLGLIIDLTNTTRYYSLQDVPQSLHVVKIFTAGHEVPNDATILTFKRIVRRFLRDNQDNENLIGVHCTHGLNRTGYLICRYLIDVEGMDPGEAVQLFNCSRGHAMERQNYLDDLQHGPRRSNRGMEESELQPQRGEAPHRGASGRWDSRETRVRGGDGQSPWKHRSDYRWSSNLRPHHSLPPLRAPPHPYRWTPPHPGGEWRRPSCWEEGRYSYMEPGWSRMHEERRALPPPPPPSFLPPFSPTWMRDSNDWREEDWRRPRHRVNGHNDY